MKGPLRWRLGMREHPWVRRVYHRNGASPKVLLAGLSLYCRMLEGPLLIRQSATLSIPFRAAKAENLLGGRRKTAVTTGPTKENLPRPPRDHP